jgi:23S rRNA pseudouridine2605 synthase
MGPVRLHKLLAEAGVASRRAAERLIAAGRVRVNGVAVVEPGTHADPLRDTVEVDGQPLPKAEPKRYVLLHKPRGYLTTREDPRGRRRVFDLVPDLGVRLHSVGRLDFDAEGLLLLTNDGDLTYRLTHPRHGVRRVYHVLVEGRLDRAVLAALERGVVLEDGPARVERARLLRAEGAGLHWVELSLAEGRYREVKRLCRAVGLMVQRLRRVAFGPLRLRDLAPGQWRELAPAELTRLTHPGPGRRSGRDP